MVTTPMESTVSGTACGQDYIWRYDEANRWVTLETRDLKTPEPWSEFRLSKLLSKLPDGHEGKPVFQAGLDLYLGCERMRCEFEFLPVGEMILPGDQVKASRWKDEWQPAQNVGTRVHPLFEHRYRRRSAKEPSRILSHPNNATTTYIPPPMTPVNSIVLYSSLNPAADRTPVSVKVEGRPDVTVYIRAVFMAGADVGEALDAAERRGDEVVLNSIQAPPVE